MFQPGDLICSVQSTHNNIRIVGEQEELDGTVSIRKQGAGDQGTITTSEFISLIQKEINSTLEQF